MKQLRHHKQIINLLLVTLMAFWQIGQPLQATTLTELLGDDNTDASLITGGTGLEILGGGSIRLTNLANDYTGVTSIKNGSLIITDPVLLGTSTTAISILSTNTTPSNTAMIGFGGGSLVLDGTTTGFNFSRNINFEGRGPIGDRGAAILSLGNNTLSGLLTSAVSPLTPTTFRNSRINSVNGTLTIAGTLTVGGTVGTTVTTLGGVNTAGVNNFSFAGGTLAGTGTLEKSGAGVLGLNGNASTFTGAVRVSGSAIGQQSSVRVTQTTVGGTSVFGAGTVSGINAAIDLNGGVLEFRSNSNLDFSALASGKNAYLRSNSTVYTGPAAGGDAVNGVTTLGLFRVAANSTATFNSRNGFGVTLGAWTQESTNNNNGIANNMGGTLNFTGDAWNNSDGSARNLTFSGNGNTRIAGNITATGLTKNVVKQGTGELILNGTGGTFTGVTNIEGGAVRITDFRSLNNASLVAVRLGNAGTTAGSLIIGGTGAGTGTIAGLTTSKPIVFNSTTGQSAIYANQAGANPVILNGAITSVATTGNVNLGGSNTADNIITTALPIGGTGGLTKVGVGTWVLSAANLYAGATTIQNGTLKLRATGTVSNVIPEAATNTIVFNAQATAQTAGGTLEFRGDATGITAETLGALTPTAGASTVRLLGQGGFASNLTFTSLGTVSNASGVNFDTTGANGGVVTLTGATAATATTLPGAGHLYINGASFADVVGGVVTAPTYGGAGIFRDAGPALVAANHNRLTAPTASGAATISSLLTNNQSLTLSGNLVVSTGGILQSGGTATIQSDSATTRLIQGGAAGTNIAVRVNLSTDVLNLGTATNPVNIPVFTTGGLTKNGAGTLVIAGVNAQTGTTTINEGTVRLLGATSRLSATTASLVIRQGAVLQLDGHSPSVARVNALDGSGTISNANASAATFQQDGTGTWNGVFTNGVGVLNINKTGGAATWSGLSTYTGVTNIQGTGLVTVDTLANGGAVGGSGIGSSSSAASNLLFSGSTAGIDYRGNIIDNALTLGSRSASTDRLFTLAAAATGAQLSSTVSNNNAIVWSNTGSIVNNTTANATLTLSGTSTGDNTLNPQLVDSSVGGGVTLGLTKSGAGQWNLGNSNNTYTGITLVGDGILGLNNAGALPANSPLVLGVTTTSGILQTSGSFTRNLSAAPTAGTGTITWGGSTGGGGFAAHSTALTVTLDGGAGLTWGSGGFVGTGGVQSLILNSGSSLADVTFTNAIDLGAAARTVTVNDNANTGADYANMTAVLSGAGGGLFKNGAGVLRVGNANTYTGNTAVDAGSLVISTLGNSTTPGATSVGDSTLGNVDAGAVILGNATTTGGNLVYVGAGETSDRKIRLRGTTANSAIYADGAGPLILTNVAHDTTETGSKTLSLRGTNTAGNTISSVLADNGVGVLSVTVDGSATWILNNPGNTYTGTTTAGGGALGIGDNAALGTSTLVNNNGNVFAYGADRTIANALTLGGTNGWLGDHSITIGGVTNSGATTANITTNNNIVAGEALTLNNGVTANGLTANRAWIIDGTGETIINGNLTTTTGFGVRFDVVGGGTLNLGTNGAASNFNQSIAAADVDRGTLKFSANEAIPTTFAAATQTNSVAVPISGTTYTVASTVGLIVGQTFSGTNVPAGSRIATIVDGFTFTTTAPPTVAVASGVVLTFAGSGGVTLTPELATTDTARIDLNGTTQTFNAFTATSDGVSIIDNSAATAATFRVGANNTVATFGTGGTGTYSITESGGGAINLTKIGAQTANFTGSLGNTGVVTSNGGVLNLNSATGATGAVGDGGTVNFKGGFTTPGNLLSVTTDNGGLVSFASGSGTPFANLTNLSLSATANSGLELDVGDTATDKLTSVAAAVNNVTTLFIKDIDITGGNTYDLIANAGGGLGVLGNYLLNLPGYSGSTLTVSPTLVQLNAGTLITSDVYWNNGTGLGGGSLTQAWNTVDPTTTNINFSGVVAGTPALQLNENLPGKGQKVIFQGDNITGGAPLATTLEQAFTVNTLEFRQSTTAADTSRTISIAPGVVSSNSLTLKPSLATDGINLQTGATGTVTISAPFVASTDQTWTVATAPVELLGGVITGTTNVAVTDTSNLRRGMTVTGTGIAAGTTIASIVDGTNFTLSTAATDGTTNVLAAQQLNMTGPLSGAGDVVTAGGGKVVLSGANGTLGGTFTTSAGITQVNTLSALGGLVGVPGSGTDLSVAGGAFFYNNGTAGTFVNDIALNGGTLSSGGNSHTYSGAINVAANSSINMRDQAVSTAFTTTARSITLSGLVSGTNALNVDSVTTASAGNQITGNLVFNNAASTWNGDLNMTRGSVFFQNVAGSGNATPYFGYDGIINFNQFGRAVYRNIDGTSLNRTAAVNVAAAAVGELSIDNVGAVATNYVVNQQGAVNLNGGSILRLSTDDGSELNLTGGVVLNGNASITVQGSAQADNLVTISTVGISGTGNLAINDEAGVWNVTSRTLRIDAAGSFVGNTSLNEGTLILGHKDALNGVGDFTITGSSAVQAGVDLSGANAVANPTTLNNNLTVLGSNNLELSGTFTGNGLDGSRTLTNSLTAGALTLSGSVNLGAVANTAVRNLTITGAGNTAVSGVISDGNAFANGIIKNGAGTLTLSNTNLYTGATNLAPPSGQNRGVILATANNALGTGAVTVTYVTGALVGQLQLSGGITLGNSSFTTTGAGSDGTTSGLIRNISGNNIVTGDLNLIGGGGGSVYRSDADLLTFSGNVGAFSAGGQRELLVVGAGNFEFSGVLRDSNVLVSPPVTDTLRFVTLSAGTTTFSGATANTYTGLTTVTAGTLSLNKTAGVNAIAGSGLVDVVPDVLINGGTLRLLANNQIADTVTINQTSGAFRLNGKTETIGTYTKSGGLFSLGIGGSLTLLGNTFTFTGPSAPGDNVIDAEANLTDASINLNSGAIVEVYGSNNAAYSPGPYGTFGGTLQVNAAGTGLTFGAGANTVNLDSDATATDAGKLLLKGNVSTTGTGTATIASVGVGAAKGIVDLDGGTRTFTVAAANPLTVSAVITNGAVTKDGAGTLSLTADNTYSGKTTVTLGTILIGSETALGTAPGAPTADHLELNGGTLRTNATMAIDDTNRGITLAAGGGTFETDSATTLTVSNVVAGAGDLTKQGSGTAILANANTYTGQTVVINGTLQVGFTGTGSTGTGLTTVQSGGTIAGTGTVLGNASISGSLRPGDTAGSGLGVLTYAGDLTLAGTPTSYFQIGDPTLVFDQVRSTLGTSVLTLAGIVDVGGSFDSGYVAANGDTWFLFKDFGSIVPGTFNVATDITNLPTLTGLLTWDLTNFTTNGSIKVLGIPEPSRMMLLFLGLLVATFGRRRRD